MRCIVCAEDFCRQVVHEVLEILVQVRRANLIKDLVSRLLGFHKNLNVFEHLCRHCHGVLVADGILAQEVKVDRVRWRKRQVFDSQRAAADCVCFFLRIFFSTHTQGKLVNEISCCGLLPFYDALALLQLLVRCPDLPNGSHEPPCSVVLEHIRLTLQTTCRSKGHILGFLQQAVLEVCNPLDGVFMHDVFPGMSRHARDFWHRSILCNVQ
mmetsp:Transcript_18726/g.32859  ORF Transcript_18726/g.32859 Transcript_18726/m.32859 type:complete len:211 (-) Transcript_18726:725-1357(-)